MQCELLAEIDEIRLYHIDINNEMLALYFGGRMNIYGFNGKIIDSIGRSRFINHEHTNDIFLEENGCTYAFRYNRLMAVYEKIKISDDLITPYKLECDTYIASNDDNDNEIILFGKHKDKYGKVAKMNGYVTRYYDDKGIQHPIYDYNFNCVCWLDGVLDANCRIIYINGYQYYASPHVHELMSAIRKTFQSRDNTIPYYWNGKLMFITRGIVDEKPKIIILDSKLKVIMKIDAGCDWVEFDAKENIFVISNHLGTKVYRLTKTMFNWFNKRIWKGDVQLLTSS